MGLAIEEAFDGVDGLVDFRVDAVSIEDAVHDLFLLDTEFTLTGKNGGLGGKASVVLVLESGENGRDGRGVEALLEGPGGDELLRGLDHHGRAGNGLGGVGELFDLGEGVDRLVAAKRRLERGDLVADTG